MSTLTEGKPWRRNPSNGECIVAKFGGTALGKYLENLAEQIVPNALDRGQRLVLVCSARSGDTKATGTTNLLLKAAAEALQSNPHNDPTEVANDRYSSPPRTPSVHNGPGTSSKAVPLRTASSSVINNLTSFPSTRASSPSPYTLHSRSSFSNANGHLSNSVSSLLSLDEQSAMYFQPPAFNSTIDQIKADHLQAAKQHVRDPDILARLEEELEWECERLRSFLLAAQIINEISLRSKDVIVGVGEKLSCRIVAAVLRDRGIDSEFVSLDNIIDRTDSDQQDVTLSSDFYATLAERLGARLTECEDRVPVVTGFFGVVPGSILNQIGRGYTDFCAALCAVGTQASELQIWKEVDGIFTADPRKVPTARLLPLITPEEAAELTYYGSEVIHPFTMEQVINASIPIRIKNVENPNGAGTVIFPEDASLMDRPSLSVLASVAPLLSDSALASKAKRIPTAVTIKDQILVLNIRSNRKTISHGFFAKTFTVLDKHGIIVDLISTSEVQLSLSMHSGFRKGLFDKVVKDLSPLGEVTYKRNMTILSLVGRQMKNMVGVAGRMFSVLAQGNVNIEAISQGASEMNVSCVIESKDAIKALNLVHHHLLSITPPVSSTNGSLSNGCLKKEIFRFHPI